MVESVPQINGHVCGAFTAVGIDCDTNLCAGEKGRPISSGSFYTNVFTPSIACIDFGTKVPHYQVRNGKWHVAFELFAERFAAAKKTGASLHTHTRACIASFKQAHTHTRHIFVSIDKNGRLSPFLLSLVSRMSVSEEKIRECERKIANE